MQFIKMEKEGEGEVTPEKMVPFSIHSTTLKTQDTFERTTRAKALKTQEKEAAKALKTQEKEAARALKTQEKEAVKALKTQEKVIKTLMNKAAKLQEQVVKAQERIEANDTKARMRADALVAKAQQNVAKRQEKEILKRDISKSSIKRMILTAIELASAYPDGFTAKQCSDKYIEMHGLANPYTGAVITNPKYDIHAAIRGFMYETSPSSAQHWFKYGSKKVKEQVAPWIFVNKKLATVNNNFDWKVSTKDLKVAQRQEKGIWKFMPQGPLTYYLWTIEEYGPLPTDKQLEVAKQGRKIGFRKSAAANVVPANAE